MVHIYNGILLSHKKEQNNASCSNMHGSIEMIMLTEVSQRKTNITYCLCACVLSHFQSCSTLWDPMDYSPPGSSVHGILQAKILAWVTMPSLQGIFPTQGSNPRLLHLLHWQAGSLPLAPHGKPHVDYMQNLIKKKKRYKWTYLQNKNRVRHVENKLMVTRGKG